MTERKIVWVGLFPPENPSVGDHSQALAIQQWFQTYFPDWPIVCFYRRFNDPRKFRGVPLPKLPSEGLKNWKKLIETVNEDDLIFIHSSGDFGTLFYWTWGGGLGSKSWHSFRRKLIRQFPKNKIIQLPVTVFYHATEGAKEILENDKCFYGEQKNLVLMCREPVSHQILTSNSHCRTMMVPDFAFSLKPTLIEKERKGVLIVLRRDHETRFNPSTRAHIIKIVERVMPNPTYRDVNQSPVVNKDAIDSILEYYQNFKVVVTDRLHGMIFSVITKTPCVCINDRIPHKSSGYKSLLNDSVQFVDGIEEIPDAIRSVGSKPFQEVDLTSHFTTLKGKIFHGIE